MTTQHLDTDTMYELYHASLDIKCIIGNGQINNYAGGDYIHMSHDHPLVHIIFLGSAELNHSYVYGFKIMASCSII